MNGNTGFVGFGLRGRLGPVFAACTMLAATTVHAQDGGDASGNVKANDFGTVTISVQDTDLAQVLEMLSIQTKKNIIASKNVSATISANLYDVTFYECMDAILKVNGYDYVEEGNFIYVYTQSELAEIEKAKRRRQSRTFELNYLSAVDASEFIAPLLSEEGSAKARGEVEANFAIAAGNGGADGYAFTARVVVNDYPENLDSISALLTEIDTPPHQVLVEATILQTALDEANAFGVDFSTIGSIDFTNLTNPLSVVGNLLSGSESGPDEAATRSDGFEPGDNRAFGATSSVGNASGPGGFKLGVLRDDISIFIRLLDQVSDTVVLARPKIMCLNRQRAQVLVGAKVGYLSTTATETTSTQSVEFLNTGIQLQLRPFIASNGDVRMELRPSVSEAQLRNTTDANGIAVTIPDELTNEVTTNVRVHDGQTLVLGGLFKESTTATRRQVPILGDLPVIGYLARGHEDTIARDEIIFMITPTIVQDEKLYEVGQETLSYVDRVQLGIREGLLPFGRSKITERHNQAAMEAYEQGHLDEAMYHLNNSLRLNSSQPEMVKFRQKVTGVRETPHERSVMERAFRRELGDALKASHREASAAFSGDGWYVPVTNTAFTAGASTWASNTSGDWTSDTTQAASTFQNEGFTTTSSERQAFVDRFIHEYFTAAGLSEYSPFYQSWARSDEECMDTEEVAGASDEE